MNKNKTPFMGYLIMMIVSLFLITACASTPVGSEAVPSMVSAENPVEMVNQLAGHIGDARKNQLNILSTTWYARAEGF